MASIGDGLGIGFPSKGVREIKLKEAEEEEESSYTIEDIEKMLDKPEGEKESSGTFMQNPLFRAIVELYEVLVAPGGSRPKHSESGGKDPDSKKKEQKEKEQGIKGQDESEQPCIVRVEFLDGDDGTILTGIGDQFVNLPADPKWVDGTRVKNLDRLSRKPRIKVEFDRPGAHSFRVKYKPGSGNAVYTSSEKSRNSKFKYQDQEKSYTTESDGTKIICDDFFIAVAGNDQYRLEASDDYGNTVTSQGEIRTTRLIHFVQVKMAGLTGIASSMSAFTAEFERNFYKMVSLPDVEMAHMHNISTDDQETFRQNARAAYTGSQGPGKAPCSVAIGFTDQLAVKNPNQIIRKRNVKVGPGEADVEIGIAGPGLTNSAIKTRALWKDVVPGEGWFVSCEFLKTGGTPGRDEVVIAEAKCQPLANARITRYFDKVKVKVDHLSTATGTLTLKVNWVDRMRGGLSFGGGNLICVCTRAWWRNKSTAAQNRVIVHEMGHKVGMVADGTAGLPDKVATHYDSSRGHVGNHCYFGCPDGQARYDSRTDTSNSKCVMFGATNGKGKFCTNCEPAVRKVDISDGWSGF